MWCVSVPAFTSCGTTPGMFFTSYISCLVESNRSLRARIQQRCVKLETSRLVCIDPAVMADPAEVFLIMFPACWRNVCPLRSSERRHPCGGAGEQIAILC